MDVSTAVANRVSVRAFKPDPVPAATVRDILDAAHRSPSGGNLQPWRVYALAGAPLAALVADAQAVLLDPAKAEEPDYDVYPKELWDPFRTRRYQNGEDLYATIRLPREDKRGRLQQLAKNAELFGAPVGLFFCLDRKLGRPQWADCGMYMQSVMLLALERGLDTCAQEFWARFPRTVGRHLQLDDDHMLFSGMALGFRDPDAPINTLRTRRDPFDSFAELRGF